jgi:pyruvate,orthophosphate dikinase
VSRAFAIDQIPRDRASALAIAGGKATNLAVMSRELGLAVPPAFVITTETCRAFLADGWPDDLEPELRERMAELEASVGRRFGDPADPLLVSVRSGAPVSMPGMMDTILNLGLTEATAAGLAAIADPAFARDCRERFEASFTATVRTSAVPDEVWAQLRLAIEAVFRSWNSARARAYRAREGIADDLGTAVTVQAMVFGNRGPTSATGVLFTRNPATGEPTLFGDVLFDAQGEDVVAGTHRTEPIAVLDERMPVVAAELRDHAARLEHHFADMCDVEFTIEDGRLWMLQVRVGKRTPQAALRIARDMAEDPGFPLTRADAVSRVIGHLADPPKATSLRSSFVLPLASGLPASPGSASGPVATTPAAAIAAAEAGRPAILVRAETSPEDVAGMAAAVGILTSRGGLASHAAVVARGWGIPAVVGAAGVVVSEDAVLIGDRVLPAGDELTIDGSTGEVFAGVMPSTTEVVPEARTLLEWARELGIDVASSPAGPDAAANAIDVGDARKVTPDACLRIIAVKGFATAQAVADGALATVTSVEPVLAQLAIDGLIATTAGAYRLTGSGTTRSDGLLATEQAAWGIEAATAALDAFVALDQRVKAGVTAWQVRDEAAGILNDHADARYDAAVLERLAAVHEDAVAWLGPVAAAMPRLGVYGERLTRALEAAGGGDGRFVASPRVDSYHGIWFELHEDLIRLAARTREGETAAGRA